MGRIKAIPTEYNGYVFRSRLEARWAVFFDALDIEYEYEIDGFEFSDGTKYLPDFYLPDIDGGMFIEVKGRMDDEDYHKVEKFWEEGSRPLYVLGGLPTQDDLTVVDAYPYVDRYKQCFEYGAPVYDERADKYFPFSDWPYLFCVCPACGKIGVEFDGRGWRVCGEHHKDKNLTTETYKDEDGVVRHFTHPEVKGWRTDDKGYSWNQRRLVAAYKVARQAKFDHGLTPTKQEVQRRFAAEKE